MLYNVNMFLIVIFSTFFFLSSSIGNQIVTFRLATFQKLKNGSTKKILSMTNV